MKISLNCWLNTLHDRHFWVFTADVILMLLTEVWSQVTWNEFTDFRLDLMKCKQTCNATWLVTSVGLEPFDLTRLCALPKTQRLKIMLLMNTLYLSLCVCVRVYVYICCRHNINALMRQHPSKQISKKFSIQANVFFAV